VKTGGAMFSFRCNCGKQFQVREDYVSQTTTCPACGKELTIPGVGAVHAGEPPMVLLAAVPPGRGRGDDACRHLPPPAQHTSGAATFALMLGAFSFCLPVLLSIPAILLGILGLVDVKKGQGRVEGRGKAISAILLGVLSTVIGPILLYLIARLPRIDEVGPRQMDMWNLQQVDLALIDYADAHHGMMPPATVYSKTGRPLYSWRVLILPYIEQEKLYHQFHLDEPWDSPHNLQFVKRMPHVYANPLDDDEERQGLTHYMVFVGSDLAEKPRPAFINDPRHLQPFIVDQGPPRVFATDGGAPRFPATFTDGTSNTILVASGADPVPWTKPEDLHFSARGPLLRLSTAFKGGSNVGLADGSARFLFMDQLSPQTLRAAITADGGEVLGADWDD
jgi:hypothetical protein